MKKIIALGLALSPMFAFAQTQLNNIDDVAAKATNLGNLFVTILISLSVVWIIFSVVRYLVIGSTNEEGRKNAKYSILFGILGLVIIFSIWGIVNLVRNSFKTQDQLQPNDIRNIQLQIPSRVQ